MADLQTALTYNWGYVIVGIVLAAIVVQFLIKLADYFIEKLGITTRKSEERKADKEMLNVTTNKVNELETSIHNLQEDIAVVHEESQKSDAQISNQLTDIAILLDKLSATVDVINTMTANGNEANIEIMHDIIQRRCGEFIARKKVAPDEREWLVRNREIYTKLGGNHGLQDYVDFTLDRVEIG